MLQKQCLDSDAVQRCSHVAETHNSMYKSPQTEICTSHSLSCLTAGDAANGSYWNEKLCPLCSHLHLQYAECRAKHRWLQLSRSRGHHWWMLYHHLIIDHYQNQHIPSLPFTSFHPFYFTCNPGISVWCGYGELGPNQRPQRKWRDIEREQGLISQAKGCFQGQRAAAGCVDAAHIHRWAATEVKINNRAKGTA